MAGHGVWQLNLMTKGSYSMENYIVCPSSKLFVLPALAIKSFLEDERNEKAFIIASGEAAQIMERLGLGVNDDSCLYSTKSPHVNLVVVQHNSVGTWKRFERLVTGFLDANNEERLTVSFWPDGLGNASWGERLDRKYLSEHGVKIKFREFYSFGFIHTSTARLTNKDAIQLIDYKNLTPIFEENPCIRAILDRASATLQGAAPICVLPFRPWCTAEFHGGVYNFGSLEGLARIYSELVGEIENCNGGEVSIVFRPDDRFPAESRCVQDLLQTDRELIDLSGFYPQWLTLEPLLYELYRTGRAARTSMVCLDSTSFQAAPFISDGRHPMQAVIGAKYQTVAAQNGGVDFMTSKLLGKVRDFYRRYHGFMEEGRVKRILRVEESLFIVEA